MQGALLPGFCVRGRSGGLNHFIVLGFGDACFDKLFIIAPPLLVLIEGRNRCVNDGWFVLHTPNLSRSENGTRQSAAV